jgi:hypothetical protein
VLASGVTGMWAPKWDTGGRHAMSKSCHGGRPDGWVLPLHSRPPTYEDAWGSDVAP